jgi:integrase
LTFQHISDKRFLNQSSFYIIRPTKGSSKKWAPSGRWNYLEGNNMAGEIATKHPGIRYRKHKTRKHGVMFDRYFLIRHTADGQRVNEGLGWLSDGWTEKRAVEVLAELNRNKRTGVGPKTLKEKRAMEAAEKAEKDAAEKAAKAEQERLNISFKQLFDDIVLPDMKSRLKLETWNKAESHVKVWIDPVTGVLPIRFIGLEHVQKIKERLAKAGRSPRTLQYVFRTFEVVWDAAVDKKLVSGKPPTKSKSFKLPKVDNERQRYLSIDEEKRLLGAVLKRGKIAHDMAVVSIDCGLRFSEIARLAWGDVHIATETINVLDSKGRDRQVPITARVKALFESLEQVKGDSLIFPARGGKVQYQVPSSFKRGVVDAKLNEGITNRKMKASFHTLRHTYASRMVQAGVDLYRVQRLLGHSTPVMTARYSKLADDDLRNAVHAMELANEAKGGAKIIPLHKVIGK